MSFVANGFPVYRPHFSLTNFSLDALTRRRYQEHGAGKRSQGGICLALYVVATPVGNLEDITLRALKILKEVEAVIAEDTRTFRKLSLRHSLPPKPVYSLYQGNESARVEQLLPRLQAGLEAALVTESGTPAVSDPGALLVRRCLESAVRVVPIPGPSALTAALSIAGVFAGRVTFVGFLSRKNPALDLLEILHSGSAAVFFEHPGRLARTIAQVSEAAPGARLVIGRELTKQFEEVWSGTAADAAGAFAARTVKGEGVVGAEPAPPSPRRHVSKYTADRA